MFTARVIQQWGLGGTYLVPSYPKQFGHTTNTRFGRENHFFAAGVSSRNISSCFEFRKMHTKSFVPLERLSQKYHFRVVKTTFWER